MEAMYARCMASHQNVEGLVARIWLVRYQAGSGVVIHQLGWFLGLYSGIVSLHAGSGFVAEVVG